MFKDISKAKKIFIEYNGSHFFMDRGGEYKNYKKFRVSKEQEYEWIKEYQQEILLKVKNNKLPVNKLTDLCLTISQYHTLDITEGLIKIVEEKKELTDTFSLLLIAESINNLAENLKNKKQDNQEIIIQLKHYSISLLKWLLEQPITVADTYFQRTYLGGKLEKQQIIKRINDDLNLWID